MAGVTKFLRHGQPMLTRVYVVPGLVLHPQNGQNLEPPVMER